MLNPGIFLKFPLENLNRMGLLLTGKTSRTAFLITHLLLLLFGFLLVIICMQYFYMIDDVTAYVNNFEGVIAFIQAPIKWYFCIHNKEQFLNLAILTKQFWNDGQCSRTTKTDNQIIMNRILLLQKLFSALLIFIFIIIIPYSIAHENLIIGDWQMEKNKIFKLVWIIVVISCGIFVLFAGFYDSLYLSFCFEVKTQCTILFDHLEQLNVETINCESQFENYYKNLQTYIEHHILLLKFHEEMQKAYSVPLMFQYLTATPLMCAEMYAFTVATNPYMMIRYAISVCAMIFQTGFYCIPGNYVEHAMSTISTAIYNSDWYSKHFLKLRTPIILMIQRAQRKVSLTACGLVEINIETFLKSVKLALSICVALRSFKISNLS